MRRVAYQQRTAMDEVVSRVRYRRRLIQRYRMA